MAQNYKHVKRKISPTTAKILIISAIALVFLLGLFAIYKFVLTNPKYIDNNPTEPATEQIETQEPTEAPTQEPTQAPIVIDEKYMNMAKEYIKDMSDKEKFCQMMIVTPESLTGVDVATVAGDATKEALEKYPVGGIIYFSQNLEDKDQTTEMIKNSQSYSKTPMFIAIDEEGKTVARAEEKLDVTKFENMYKYKDKGEKTAYDNAKTIASDISKFGFNLDLAPVADVWSNPSNTVIGERAYSDDFGQAASLVSSAVKGFKDGGVMTALKHFPGHGDTTEDTHEKLAYVNKTKDVIINEELLPFKSGLEAGADMVMVGHLVVSDIDENYPATLSPKVISQLLKEELRYDGVVISDSFQMAAITDNYTANKIVKNAVNAGVDILLMPENIDDYLKAFETAVKDGSITQEQIDNSVTKIIALKYKNGLLTDTDSSKTSATESTEAATNSSEKAATEAASAALNN